MKNIFYVIVVSLLSLTFSSCEDWLERKDNNSGMLSEADIFKNPNYIQSFAFRMYDCTGLWFETAYADGDRTSWWWTGGQHRGKSYCSLGCATGEMMSYRTSLANVDKLIPGLYQELVNYNNGYLNDFGPLWGSMWEMIYVANTLIAEIPKVSSSVLTTAEKNQYIGEAYAYRAMGYYELVRRWGALPYVDKKMTINIDMDVPGTPVQEIADKIAADCDQAIKYLPELIYQIDSPYFGRLGKSSAYGLKSLIRTMAASPIFNEGNDPELWKKAAEAAWDVIEVANENPTLLGLYDATANGTDVEAVKESYRRIFIGEPITVEAVWPRWYTQQDYQAWQLTWFWARKSNAAAKNTQSLGFSPTQEMVNRFETNDGIPVDDEDNTLYNKEKPYANRDPRFYANILYHGAKFIKTSEDDNTINMLAGAGSDMADNPTSGVHDGNSCTGYIVGKMQPEKCNESTYTKTKYFFNTPKIRMAEIYLNYAEAMNEYEGPSAKISAEALTSLEALNAVRNRAGQADVASKFTGSKELFRDRIKNEFWVELCYEDHIFHDLRRWKDAKDYLNGTQFHGVIVSKDASKPDGVSYQEFQLPAVARVFEDKHYLYPFKSTDLYTYKNLKQNPGW